MAQCGRTPSISTSTLHLASTPWFLPALTQLAESGVVVYPLAAAIISDCLGMLNTMQCDGNKQDVLQSFLSRLLEQLSFTDEEAGKLFKVFAELPLQTNKWYHDILHQLEKSYPVAFDKAVQINSNLIGLIPGYTARNDIFQRLNHPESSIRLEAINYIKSQDKLHKEDWVIEALLNHLTDESTAVVSAVLEVADALPRHQLRDQLSVLAARCWHSNSSLYSLGPVVLSHLQGQKGTDATTVLLLVLPYLLLADDSKLPVAKAVLKSGAVKNSELLKPLGTRLTTNAISPKSLCAEVFKFITKELSHVNMDDLLKSGKQLESHGTVYQLLTLVVAAGTLQGQISLISLKPLIDALSQYNNSSVSSEVHGELNKKTISTIVNLCRNGKLPFQGSLYVLSSISNKMKSPFPEGKFIFDVKEPYVALVAVIFGFFVNMKKSKNTYISEVYSKLCKGIFEKCCTDTESQIDLLSNIALGFPDIADECLLLINQLVEELSSVSEQILVPALLVALRSENEKTRLNALSLLHSLTQKLALPTYHKLLDQLSQHSHEIAIDHEQVNVVLYLCLSPDPSVQSLLSKSLRLDMTVVLHSLVNIIVSPDTPAYISSSLLKTLDQVNSESLLERLLPLGMKILLSENRSLNELSILQAVIRRINITTASAFNDNYIWTFLETCLKDHKVEVSDGSMPVVLMLHQFDRELFAALSDDQQERIVTLVVSCVAETEHSDVTSAAASVFKRVSLDAKILVPLLERMRDVTIDPPVQSSKKRGWSVKQPPPLELLTTTAWKRGLCLLEFIQNKKKLENVQVLLSKLFEILNRCLQFEEQSPVEYTKQVLLTSLLHCCVKLSPDGCPVDLPESSLQVELVVECIRVSSNPQTHHHALLVLAYMANMIPERVLHCVMPIFTFMGSSVLRQDDAYSFQIISKIVETIVPVLIKSKEDEELSPEVVGVLRVFATALLDIPEHRRTPLYTKLLLTLRQGHFLWAFLSLVFETHVLQPSPDNTNTAKEPGSIPKRLEVSLRLCHHFPPTTILSTASELINYLCQLPVDKGDKRLKEFKKSSVGSLFDVERVTDKQLRHYTYTALTFLSFLLSSKQFLRIMAALATEVIEDMKETFQKIFEGILTFTQTVSKQMDSSVGQLTAKYWKSMFNICFDVLAKTNALLPGDMFLDVIASLLAHPLVSLRCKSLELLNWRLQQAQPMDSARLLSLLNPLLSLVKADSSEQHTQQIALLSIKLMARQLAADHSAEFQPVFKAATKILKERSIRDPVLASAVLCIGELCHTLGARAIVSLPNFMPAILSILQNDKLVGSGDLLLISVVSAVHKIVDSLVSFLSPYLDKLLQQLCILSDRCVQVNDNPKLQPVLQKIKSIRQTISADVPLRVLLPSVTESYSRLVSDNHTSAVPHLMSLLGNSFKSGQQVNQDLTSFILTALDFRSQSSSTADVDVIEPAVISATIALVLKLSESSFRPLYYKIFNWAFQSNVNKDRSLTFYKLTCSVAESLKGLFLTFAHYFLKNAAMLLDENNKMKQEITWNPSKANELVEAILTALHTVFVHDTSHFINKERFETLMQPIVDQLENELGGTETMVQRTTHLVIPCLTQMAVSAADDTLWKQLNYQILLKTRHNIPQVRIGGVLAVGEIAKKLGEEFLPLLPETVPFLAELLEDEDENVEKTSQRVVQELEAALGEQISKYF